MKKSILKIVALVMIISIAFVYRGDLAKILRGSNAYAVGDLSVNWGVPEDQPIFTVSNITPGQTETRTVMVTNDASVTRPVAARGIKTSETGALASAFLLTIRHNGTDVYGGISPTGPKTLQQFFDESALDGVFITNLGNGASTSIIFIAEFAPASGNEFQAKNLAFTIQIGLSVTTPAECAQNNLDGDVIFGTQNADLLRGTARGDLIFALEGNDVVQGRGGDDCIVGGAGNDSLLGEAGADTLIGSGGNDSMVGGLGNDQIFGNENADSISAGDGDDVIFGGDGIDSISADGGNDQIFAEGGADSVSGGAGNDLINGGAGIDSGTGGIGTDTCQALELKASCEL